jgi:GNAT superfamily N-acetyltransferase
MEYELLGWAPDGPTLDLDHERFSYAGKFVMSSTGKAVVREEGNIVAAIAFNDDRTDERVLWIRYVTVRVDRRGEGIGSRLAAALRASVLESGYDCVRIAVNNPFAFEALSRAGFHATGETTGLAERILEAPGERSPTAYRHELAAFRDRDTLDGDERAFVREQRETGLSRRVDAPPLTDTT